MTRDFHVMESFLQEVEGLEDQLEPISDGAIAPDPIKRGLDGVSRQNSTKQKRKKKRLNPSWLKRRNELETLREQAKAMEKQVEQLEIEKLLVDGTFLAFSVRKIKTRALVEKHRRRAAQAENEQLKAKLQLRTKQSEAFQSMLAAVDAERKELLRSVVLFTSALNVEVGAGRQLRHSSSKVFDMLERKVDAAFLSHRHLLTLKQQPLASKDNALVETTSSSGIFEFSRLTLLPFDERTLSSGMWAFIGMGKFPNGENHTVVHRSDDAFAVIIRVTMTIECGDTIHIDTHNMMKRFVTPAGSVMIAKSCSTWTADFSAHDTWKHATREEGCIVMRNYSPEDGAPEGICQAQSILRLDPGKLGRRNHPLAKSCTMKEVVVPSFRKMINARHQFVENSLFDVV